MQRLLVLLAFFLSGLSTLIYEIVWIRWLTDLFGVTYHAISTVVTVFMVGLAVGALLSGRLVDRLRSPLRAYAVLEVVIGVLGLLFPLMVGGVTALYHGVHDALNVGFFGHVLVRFLLATIVLLPPTLAMGATLPCLARFFVQAQNRVGLDIGRLYGINAVGAALGCGLTGWVLITGLGLSRTNLLAVGLNGVAAVIALFIARAANEQPASSSTSKQPPSTPLTVPRTLLLAAFFTSGFTSIGYELIWTRIAALLHPNLHSAVFTLVLTFFLVGTGIGSVLYGNRWIQRVPPVIVYAVLQLLAGALALYSPYLLIIFRNHFGPEWYGFDETVRQTLELFISGPEVLLLAVVVGGAATLFGMTFPVGNRLFVERLSLLGSRVGAVYFLTTIGGVVGSFVTGFLLLPLMSAKTALIMLGAINAGVGIAVGLGALRRWSMPSRAALGAMGLAGVAAVFLHIDQQLPAHVFLNIPVGGIEVVSYRDGRSTSDGVLVRRDSDGAIEEKWLFSSGEFIGSFPFATWYPLAAHPDPQHVLILAFDSGMNSAMALWDPRVKEVTSVDISDGQSVTAPWFAEETGNVLDDPRFELVSNDARNHLYTTAEQYDVIFQGVAIYANYFHMSTREFYELCRDRLTDDGIFVTKLHPEMVTEHAFQRVLATFAEVFPSVFIAQSELTEIYLLMGSPDPNWRLDRQAMNAVWDQVAQNPDFPQLSVDEYLALHLLDRDAVIAIAGDAAVLVDDHPMRVPDALISLDTDFDALGYKMTVFRPPSDGPALHRAIGDHAVSPARLLRNADPEAVAAVESARSKVWRQLR